MEQTTSSIARRTSSSTGLSYLCSGSISQTPKRLFLCVHGWACSATDYVPLFSALTLDSKFPQDTLIVALDFPGHGDSPKSTCTQPSVASFAALVNMVRHELSVEGELLDTAIVGHSMGCRMALETFSQLKTNVFALILLDGSWVGRNSEVHAPPLTEQRVQEIQRIIDRIGMYGPLTPESFKQEMKRRLAEIDLEYEYELSREYIEWDRANMEKVLEEVGLCEGVKLLAVQSTQGRGPHRKSLEEGEEGPWVPLVREKIGKECFQGAVLQGCGHWPHVDKPEEVVRIISYFQFVSLAAQRDL